MRAEVQAIKHEFEETSMQLEQAENELSAGKKEKNFLEVECATLRDSFKTQNAYIEALQSNHLCLH